MRLEAQRRMRNLDQHLIRQSWRGGLGGPQKYAAPLTAPNLHF
jgi:hypothetical protein